MNTSTVSKKLGVSKSTVQRWVKQLGLEMKKNEMGHYLYSEKDVEALKEFQQQLQKGVPIQEMPKKKIRKGKVKIHKVDPEQTLLERVSELERNLSKKADSVVSYQLLQHRQEIEDLKGQIQALQKQVTMLMEENEKNKEKVNQTEASEEETKKSRKKTVFRSIFGL